MLSYGTDSVTLQVEDDGRGFDPDMIAMEVSRPAWGIAGMQERANLLNGTFDLNTKLNEGTCVRVTIPYQLQSEEDDVNPTDVS